MNVDTRLGLGLLPRRDVLRIASALALIPFILLSVCKHKTPPIQPDGRLLPGDSAKQKQ